jgi:hypothetical protein
MSIFGYYREIYEQIEEEVNDQSDDYIQSIDTKEYAEYLFDKYALPEIIEDTNRQSTMDKTKKEGYLYVYIRFPVIPQDKISDVLELQSQHINLNAPSLNYFDGYITTEAPADKERAKRTFRQLKEDIKHRNEEISRYGKELMGKINMVITMKKEQIQKENSIIEEISETIAIPLRQKVEASSVIPIPLETKKRIKPVMAERKTEKQTEFVLERDNFEAVLTLVDNCCEMFERTPDTYSRLKEEDLRNIILSSLNSVFEGEAVGEAFSKEGQTDIYLKIKKGQVFIAECKFWKGPKAIGETVKQIFKYLTWRNSYGVVILFSRNKGFTDVLNIMPEAITKLPSYAKALKTIEVSHFSAMHHFPDDEKKLVEMHYVVYNLYAEKSN